MSTCRTRFVVIVSLIAIAATMVVVASAPQQLSAATSRPLPRSLLLEGTVAAIDVAHRVLVSRRVLVRGGRIAAVWSGVRVPAGVTCATSSRDAGRRGLIFPGLIDIHDHPAYDVLGLFPPPAPITSHGSAVRPGSSPTTTAINGPSRPSTRGLSRTPRRRSPSATPWGCSTVVVNAGARAALGGEVAAGRARGVRGTGRQRHAGTRHRWTELRRRPRRHAGSKRRGPGVR